MSRLVLATHNQHKVAELRRILADAGVQHELVGTDEFPDLPDVAETGVTFAANALLKAHAVAAATGLPAIADDSGLCVDVLGGMPGVFSARWAGRTATTKRTSTWSWRSSLMFLTIAVARTSRVPRRWRCPVVGSTWSRAGWSGR